MRRRAVIDAVFLLVALAAAAPFVLPLAGIATGPAGDDLRLYVGNLSKLAFLACAAVASFMAAARFEPDNPMRPVWRRMAAGLVTFVAGEVVLATYQVVWRMPSPFPSLADAFFIVAYPFLLAALVRAISAYAETGYPIGSRRERVELLPRDVGALDDDAELLAMDEGGRAGHRLAEVGREHDDDRFQRVLRRRHRVSREGPRSLARARMGAVRRRSPPTVWI